MQVDRPQVPQVLGDMCDSMWQPTAGSVDETVCQGCVCDIQSGICTFFGQPQKRSVDLMALNTCNEPDSLLWLLNAGMPSWGSTLPSPPPSALFPIQCLEFADFSLCLTAALLQLDMPATSAQTAMHFLLGIMLF